MSRWRMGVFFYAVVLALLLSAPTLSAALKTPSQWGYTGTMVIPAGFQVDYYSHMAKLWQGARGEWAYRLLFTTEPHPGLVGLQAFYVLLGALSRNPPYDLPLIYHGARFVCNVLLVMALGAFIGRFFRRASERWVALVFATLVTGWGWLMYGLAPGALVPDPPIEFWLMDAYHLTGGLFMPHFSAAALLQLLTLMLLDDWRREGGVRRLALLTVVMAVSASLQPYVVLLMLPLCSVYALYTLVILPRRSGEPASWRIVVLAVPLAAQGLMAVWQFLALTSDPIWRSFTAQNVTLSPTPLHYLFGYGPFLLPILIAVGVLWRRRALRWPTAENAHWLLPSLWVVLVVLLVYAPFPTQRRYLLGVQSALAVLAAWAWVRLIMPGLGRRKWAATSIYVGSGIISFLLLLLANITGLDPVIHTEAYVNADALNAAAWIREHTPPTAHILTAMDILGQGNGGRVVWLTGRTVYLGHWIETADYVTKIEDLRAFYRDSSTDEFRRTFLHQHAIDVIWYDQSSQFADNWPIANADYLTPVFTSETVTLYAPK